MEGQIVESTIERLVPGGMGLAHASGQTLFVALSAPGDVVRVRIEQVHGRVAFGSIVEELEPSPARVTAPCPHFGACGGCDWQHLAYEAQLRAKQNIIRDCLQRIAGITWDAELPMIPSPQQWSYRSRTTWRLDPARRALGYYEHGTHIVHDVETCPVLVPALQAELQRARQQAAAGQLPGGLDQLAVAASGAAVARESRPASKGAELSCTVTGERYRFDAGCFFQTNLALLPELVRETLRGTPESGDAAPASGWAVDLFCGVGLFTVPLARRFERVTGVEANRRATHFARRNLKAAGRTTAEIVCEDVGRWLATRSRTPPPDLVVVDPPRTGIEAAAVRALAAWRPRHITYVSCDPATLARDLRQLVAAGYALRSVVGLDMFPQTHHVEMVAQLER